LARCICWSIMSALRSAIRSRAPRPSSTPPWTSMSAATSS
jgi:hypothetical protein